MTWMHKEMKTLAIITIVIGRALEFTILKRNLTNQQSQNLHRHRMEKTRGNLRETIATSGQANKGPFQQVRH